MRMRILTASLVSALFLAPDSALADSNRKMLEDMIGNWQGGGQLTYTKSLTFPFKCKIEGRASDIKSQVDLVGKCWYGPMWGSMGAALRYNPRTKSYIGKFQDGTRTFVIDMRGKPAERAMDLDLQQGAQRGALALKFRSRDTIAMKISVVHPTTRASKQVVDLTLNRANTKVGALAR